MNRTASLNALLALTLIACAGQAQKFAMRPTERTLAAVGTIELEVAKSGNNAVRIEVDHLPLPLQLDPKASTYVVWFRSSSTEPAVPMGAIRLDDDRHGKVELTTPLKVFEVLVTAETQPAPLEPSSLVVLRGKAEGRSK